LPASPPVPLRFTAIGVFPASGVLHLTPAASAALPALHAALHRAVGAEGRPHFQLGDWTPHCTLATGLDSAALGAGTAALAADFADFEATLSALAVVEFPPPRLHWRRKLGGAQ
jgi:2'-5' RNA ligase